VEAALDLAEDCGAQGVRGTAEHRNEPHFSATSVALTVFAAQQSPHSIRKLHPKRTRSPAVPMCL
jgi:hypothetical protein